MAAITIQQVEQNLAAMPEEQRAVAEEAMGMLSDDQLQSVLDVFDIQISVEEAPQPEAPMADPMPEEELPTLPMPEEEAPPVEEAAPLDQEMQQLNIGGQAQVAGMIDDQAVSNTEANTVSDKSETSLPEGAFVISASAVEEAGEIDLVERIIKPAIAALAKEGVSIKLEDITQPAKQLDGGVDVALSEGEIIIPPPLARKIGLGLLRKINDRGKKETEEKIEETQVAEQAPQPQPQAPIRANHGGEIESEASLKKFMDSAVKFLKEKEGYIDTARLPTDGDRLTVGHGHTEGVKKGDTMTLDEADIQLRKDIKQRLPKINKEIKKFHSLPIKLQVPLFGEFFRGSLTTHSKTGSPKTITLINQGKYKEASKEFLNNDEYNTAVARNREGIRGRMELARDAITEMAKHTSPDVPSSKDRPADLPYLEDSNNSPPEGRTTLEEEKSFMSLNNETKDPRLLSPEQIAAMEGNNEEGGDRVIYTE